MESPKFSVLRGRFPFFQLGMGAQTLLQSPRKPKFLPGHRSSSSLPPLQSSTGFGASQLSWSSFPASFPWHHSGGMRGRNGIKPHKKPQTCSEQFLWKWGFNSLWFFWEGRLRVIGVTPPTVGSTLWHQSQLCFPFPGWFGKREFGIWDHQVSDRDPRSHPSLCASRNLPKIHPEQSWQDKGQGKGRFSLIQLSTQTPNFVG